jgi:hypothetical protein
MSLNPFIVSRNRYIYMNGERENECTRKYARTYMTNIERTRRRKNIPEHIEDDT